MVLGDRAYQQIPDVGRHLIRHICHRFWWELLESNAIRQVENQEDGKEGWGEGKGIEGSDAQLCQHSISTGMKTRGGATHQLPTVPRKEETHATYLHLTLPWNSLQLWNRHNRFGECGCLIQKSIAQQNILKLNIFASSTSPN